MGKTAHTPAPWFHDVDGFGSNRVGAFGFDTHDGTAILAQVRAPDEVGFETAKANARLIAAAPDLLEALEQYLPILEALEKTAAWDVYAKGTGIASANRYRAAIARAKGGA